MSSTTSQFAHPRGPLGWLAGTVMAIENRERNRLAVEWLALQPGPAAHSRSIVLQMIRRLTAVAFP